MTANGDQSLQMGQFTESYVRERGRKMYESGQARFGIDPGHTALIVVDMTDEFVKPHWTPYWIPEATRQVPRIRSLIDKFHEAGWPVIYSADEDRLHALNIPEVVWLVPAGESMADFPEVFTKVLIHEDLKPSEGDILLQKHGYGCFFQTSLDTILRRLEVTTIVICGTVTNICCGTTAREGFAYGYRVIFGSDVNSSDDPAQHEAEVRSLRRAFARIMTAAEIEAAIDETLVAERTKQAAGPG
ncbi:MAG TPA: isochorismatase family cysteine hydrolase [Candidatus Dormibacteraeota bacterium]